MQPLPDPPQISLAQAAAASAYAAHNRAAGAARRMHKYERDEVPRPLSQEAENQVATIDELRKLDRIYEVVRRRALGWSLWEISEDMKLSHAQINDALSRAKEFMSSGITDMQEVYFHTELMRSDLLIRRYMAQAMMDQVTVEAMEKGEPIAREAIEYPMRAALICLEVMKFRCKLLGLDKSKPSKADERQIVQSQNVIGFLRTQLAFVETMVKAAPRDVLTVDVEIDNLSGGNGTGKETQNLAQEAPVNPAQSG